MTLIPMPSVPPAYHFFLSTLAAVLAPHLLDCFGCKETEQLDANAFQRISRRIGNIIIDDQHIEAYPVAKDIWMADAGLDSDVGWHEC